jgi:hypothetical protein
MPLQPNRYGDTLPSMLTPGEVVLGPKEAQRLRRPLLDVLGNRVGQATVGGRDDKFDEFGRRSFGLGDPDHPDDDWGQVAEAIADANELGWSEIGPDQEDFFHDEEYGGDSEQDRPGTGALNSQLPGTSWPGQVGLKEPLPERNLWQALVERLGRGASNIQDIPKDIVSGVGKGIESFGSNPAGALNDFFQSESGLFNIFGSGPISPIVTFGGIAGKFELGRLSDNYVRRVSGYENVEAAKAAGDDVAVGKAEAHARQVMSDNAKKQEADRMARDAEAPNDTGLPPPQAQQVVTPPAPMPNDPIADLLATITGNTVNPFGDTEEGNLEFNKVIQSGIDRLFSDLGPNATSGLVDQTFNNPNVGANILGQERAIRQGRFGDVLGEAFTGEAFGDIDDDIINSIVEERAGGQRGDVARYQARGSFSPAGVLAANEDLTSQMPSATERVREVGQGVLSGGQRDINDLRDIGTQRVQDFTLGQPDIDFSDLIGQREGLIGERQGSFGSDVRSALGSEPLFDLNQSLLSGGRSQGVVSGKRPNTLLDTIAERERRGTSTTDRRGLGTRGSGAF